MSKKNSLIKVGLVSACFIGAGLFMFGTEDFKNLDVLNKLENLENLPIINKFINSEDSNNIDLDKQETLEPTELDLEYAQKESEILALHKQLEETQNLLTDLKSENSNSQETLDILLKLQTQLEEAQNLLIVLENENSNSQENVNILQNLQNEVDDQIEDTVIIDSFDLPSSVIVIGDSRNISFEQAKAFAEIIDNMEVTPKKVAFFDGGDGNLVMVLGDRQEAEKIGGMINISVTNIVQWTGEKAEIIDISNYYYPIDIIQENGEYKLIYNREMRFVSDTPHGSSYMTMGFKDGLMKQVPESLNVLFSNANADPLDVTNKTLSYLQDWNEIITGLVDVDILKSMISYDVFYTKMIETNTVREIKNYQIQNGEISYATESSSDIILKKQVENSLLDLTDLNHSKWNDLSYVYKILSGEITQEEINSDELLLKRYQKVIDTYNNIAEVGGYYMIDNSVVYEDTYHRIYNDIPVSSQLVYYDNEGEDKPSNYKYDLVDINDDGVKELFIFSNNTLLGSYGLNSAGEPIHLLITEYRSGFSLAKDLSMIEWGSGGAFSGSIASVYFNGEDIYYTEYYTWYEYDVSSITIVDGKPDYNLKVEYTGDRKDYLMDMVEYYQFSPKEFPK